jgi:glycosyltransferase involved in cell wall biosynthesis
MRVALLTLYPSDARIGPGGVRMVSYNLVQGLKAYPDLDLHVVHCHSDIHEERTVRDGNVTIHYLATPRQRILPNLMSGVGQVVRAVRVIDPDLVHAQAANYAYAAVKSGRPSLYTIYGVIARERRIYTRTPFDRLRYGLLAYYEHYALPRVQQIVASSPYVLREYAQRQDLPWVCIENPLPQSFFDLADRAEAGRILYVGSIDERKNLLMLLRAIARLRASGRKVQLVVIGKVNSAAYEREVRAYVAANRLEECVQFLGFVERQRVIEEYERCALLALSSLEETAPMAIIEAMAAGKPVVATRVGGVPDVVMDGETGFMVPPNDDAAMAERLSVLLDDAALSQRMGRHAKEACRERYHVEQVARRYYELYNQLLARA